MQPNFINMTPHPINLINDNVELNIEPSGETIRLNEEWSVVGQFEGITDILNCVYSPSKDLPEKIDGTFYIVSAMVANAFPERNDFLIVAKTLRDDNGRIRGCTAFARV